jgi:hypothetical protein
MPCVAGIAASTRSHVEQFPSSTAYYDYFDIVVASDASEIGVEQFATRVQIMLVEYLRVHWQ